MNDLSQLLTHLFTRDYPHISEVGLVSLLETHKVGCERAQTLMIKCWQNHWYAVELEQVCSEHDHRDLCTLETISEKKQTEHAQLKNRP